MERAKSKYELEMKRGKGLPPVPSAPAKQPVDIWDWSIKIGGILTGLKTLLEIIDKLKKKRVSVNTITVPVPEKGRVIIIEKMVQFINLSRLLKR